MERTHYPLNATKQIAARVLNGISSILSIKPIKLEDLETFQNIKSVLFVIPK